MQDFDQKKANMLAKFVVFGQKIGVCTLVRT